MRIATATALTLIAALAYAETRTTLTSRRQQPPNSGITLHVTTREAVVDVIVTDSDGKPVSGLKQSDFTVKEDGKPESIRSFKETGAASPAPGPEAVTLTPRKLPPNVYTNLHATPDSGPVNIILLDVLHSTPKDMVYGKTATIDYLKSMPQGTQVAIFAWSDNKGFRLLQGLTTNGAAAAAAVTALDVEWVAYHATDRYCGLADCKAVPHSHYGITDVIDRIAAYVSGIKGRKSLMWLAGPVPIKCNETDQSVAVLFDSLMAAQVAVYPVDPGGLFNDPAVSVLNHVSNITVNTGAQVAAAGMQFLKQTGCDELGMEAVAQATGGAAYYNNNDLKSEIAKVVDQGNHYYTLTYVPPPFANDARYHSIDIKVDRPGLHLTYRKGFAAEDPAKPPPNSGPQLMQASMGSGAPPATQLLFDVRVQPSTEPAHPTDPPVMGTLDPKLKKSPLTRYSFLYLVPVSQIAFSDASDQVHSGSIEFDIAAYDSDGKLVTLRSQTMKLPLTPEEYASFLKQPFQFFQQIDLPPGPITLRVGVLDGVSQRVGTLEIPLTASQNPPDRAAATPTN